MKEKIQHSESTGEISSHQNEFSSIVDRENLNSILEQVPNNKTWGGTTNPHEHNPSQFRYLIHAINPLSQMNKLIIETYTLEYGLTRDENWENQIISMYDKPEHLGNRVSLSMSLIDQEHTGTWGDAGLIVEAPEYNVVLTSLTDMGAINDNLDFLLEQAHQHAVVSGDNLLRRSSPHSYNEVVAIGTQPDSQQSLQLKGFFYKVTPSGKLFNKQLTSRMQMHASRLGLPIVKIVEKGPYATDKIDKHYGGKYDTSTISIHYNGQLYRIAGYDPQYTFMACDERMHNRFISPEEIELVLEYAVSHDGITKQEASDLKKAYIDTDKQRQTPKVEFDNNGNVKKIIYLTGYGDTETEVSIDEEGYGYQINIVKQTENIDMYTLNNNVTLDDFSNDYIPLPPNEADSMVRRSM